MSTLYVVSFLAGDDRNATHGLRATLKYAARRGLRAINARELPLINNQATHRRDARQWLANYQPQRREEVIMTINLRKYGPANKWLKLEDFHEKPPRRERIGLVKVEDGKFGERVVLVFEPSGQMLSLNKKSVGNLLRDLGENDDDWVGKMVEISAGEVEGPQGTTDAILVCGVPNVPADAGIAAKVAKSAKAKTKAGGGGGMDDEIPFAPEWR